MKTENMKCEKLFRSLAICDGVKIDKDKRTLVISWASEEPYERYFGTEILDFDEKSVDLSRLNNGAPVLKNHNTDEQIGVVLRGWIEKRRGHAELKFSKSDLASQTVEDINDEIIRNVSVGYKVRKMEETKNGKEMIYRATDWLPLELSIVSVPADATVGIGRSEDGKFDVEITKGEPENEAVKSHILAGYRARAVEIQ